MLNVTRRTWLQLGVLAIVAVVSGSLILFRYAQVQANVFGVGRYTVTVDLPASGGLYPTANVSYRGTDVGQVTDVQVTDTGVRAILSLKSDVGVPSNSEAEVHSRSAIGEQYLDFVPKNDGSRPLKDGDVIATADTRIPPDIATLLDAANTAITAIPPDNLKTVVDEGNTAVAGLGPDLSRLVNGSTKLAIDAGNTIDPLAKLIDDAGPVLNSQIQSADSISTWADRLAAITAQLRAEREAVSRLIVGGSAGFDEGKQLLDRVGPALPIVLANLVSLGQIAVSYHAALEQTLVMVPQGVATVGGALLADRDAPLPYRGAYISFNLNVNLPQPCTTGYIPATQRRSPSDVDFPDLPAGDLYCRIPQDAQHNSVRGVRNTPCLTRPGKRAPTAALCESDQQYVPLNDGNNWKGDPNATFTGQGVPDRGPLPSAPPPPPEVKPPPAVVQYDPATGAYVGPDGRQYTQSNLAADGGPKTWQDMLTPPSPGPPPENDPQPSG